jgi:hypothetical protein
MSLIRTLRSPRGWAVVALLVAAAVLASCGGNSDSSDEPTTFAPEEVAGAFEAAAGGHPFEEATSLVDGAVAYSPQSDADPDVVEDLNKELGDSSVLWQVLIFDGPKAPLDEDAAKAAAFASDGWEEAGDGVYVGDNDIAYIANGNVVITGPVLNGDIDDETLERWQAVLDSLSE